MSKTKETLELFKAARSQEMAKAGFTQPGSSTTGLANYDLEAPAKNLFPVLTPLRNRIARVKAGGGIQANWRAITGINTARTSAGVSEGQRGGVTSHTTAEYMAAYRYLGLEDSVTFEAAKSAEGFDDAKSIAVSNLLRSLMIEEEFIDLGGNTSVALGTCATPTVATATTGGALPATTAYNVFAVGLTMAGYQQVAGYNNGRVGQTGAIAGATLVSQISRANADGTTDVLNAGVGIKSVAATITTGAGATNSITATVALPVGAVALAWFWGVPGSELLGAVTTINSVSITNVATGVTNVSTLSASDCSTDGLVYDGILSQIMKSGSGSYVKDLPDGIAGIGTPLTSDGASGIVEIENAFESFWNLYRLSPDEMFVSSNVMLSMNKLIIANGGAPLIRYNLDSQNNSSLQAGVVVASYLNKITNTYVKISVHPNLPRGMIMFWSNSVPYPLSGVANLVQKKLRYDYMQTEWPLRTRKYEYGVYFDGVLQNYFPPAFGLIRNIAA